MPRAELVEDAEGMVSPLRVWRRKGRGKMLPRIRIKCGCCDQFMDIRPDDLVTADPSMNILEISGVMGTVDQWKQVLLPLLGVKE